MPTEVKEIHATETEVTVEEFATKLNLEILNYGTGKIRIASFNISRPGLQFAGYYEHFSSERVQVVGEQETSFLKHMDAEERAKSCDELLSHDIPCLIVTTVLEPIEELMDAAVKYGRIVLRSKLRTTGFINELSIYLNELLAPSITMHGVGVLIIGNSSIGKSETALELVQRGHRLVADDAVSIKRINDRLVGTSPATIRHFMEIRGLGIIDIEKLYGSGSIRETKIVDFVACLEDWDEKKYYDRFGDEVNTYNILDMEMPEYIIPVKPGRNLASVLEVAARNFRAKSMGYNALDELNNRLLTRK